MKYSFSVEVIKVLSEDRFLNGLRRDLKDCLSKEISFLQQSECFCGEMNRQDLCENP